MSHGIESSAVVSVSFAMLTGRDLVSLVLRLVMTGHIYRRAMDFHRVSLLSSHICNFSKALIFSFANVAIHSRGGNLNG